MRIQFILLLLVTNLYAYSQPHITFQFPQENKPINCWFPQSHSNKLYVGVENRFALFTPSIESRDLVLSLDTAGLDFEIEWHATIADTMRVMWSFTLNAAENLGVYFPDKTTDAEKYIDAKKIKWEKGYKVTPKAGQNISCTLYQKINEDSLVYYQSFQLYCVYPPVPELVIHDFNYFINNSNIRANFDNDFKQAEDWYRIQRFVFTTYDNKNNVLFCQKCYGSIITPEMKQAIRDKKMKTLRVTEIESMKRKFKDIVLTKE